MKTITLMTAFIFLSFLNYAQVASKLSSVPDKNKKVLTVEASCGECNFELPGKDCDLAVRIDGKAYFVDGVNIQEYGHPHNKNGFCVAVRQAEVQGEVVNERFKATYFKLIDNDGNKSK